MTNHTYTADEFRTARFAEKDPIRTAVRMDDERWRTNRGTLIYASDMAADGWVPVREADTVSLDVLRTVWENAEQADWCRKGDVLIWEDTVGGYIVTPSEVDRPLSVSRILSRAPQREPWEDLADVLGDFAIADEHSGQRDDAGLARALHKRGVRVVTGGDEGE